MQDVLASLLNAIYPLPPPVLEEVSTHFQYLEYPKNTILLKQGRVCNYLWFLTKGALRYFYTDEAGKENNVWFSFENEFVVDTPSFVQQVASGEAIQLLEDSELIAISHHSIQNLLQKHHSFALWYIKLVEKHYVSQIEDRINDLQFLSARQRYEKLLAQFPQITNRVSLGNIASYLNITQETLSRIRAGKL